MDVERFKGCLLGLAIGDALGAKFEAQSASHLRARFPDPASLVAYPTEEMWYTDDTQLTIGVAEALVEDGEIREETLCRAFVSNYVPSRGYAHGARAVLDAMEEGGDWRSVAARHHQGGSLGNGAAMRVAPVGLLFAHDLAKVKQQARLSALPTHLHPLGIEGAQLLAVAVALASRSERFDRAGFFARLIAECESPEYRSKMEHASRAALADLTSLGNGIKALESVPTAIACFALFPDSFTDAIGHAILLGGDTDTIAAMAGAISGAFMGQAGLPSRLIGLLERSPKGGAFIAALAERLAVRAVG